MKKKWCGKTVVLLLLLSMCFCMVGCSSMDGSENEAVVAQDNRFTDGRVGQTAEGWLIAEASVDDKSIVINAPITTYPAEEVFSVSLVKDENELMALASELIMSQYTDYQEDMWGWFVERDDRLIVSLGSDNLWTTNYIDVVNDQDGIMLEEDQILRTSTCQRLQCA